MGVLRSGILGNVRGKVAGVVGSQWKDKNYIREYVKPANPNTAAQQSQRTAMSDVVAFSKALVGPVFNAYTDKFQKSMSGFNAFIKSNIAHFDGDVDYTAVLLTEGKLSNVISTNSEYDATPDNFVFTFTTNYGNNGSATDKVFGALHDTSTGKWYFPAAEVARSSLELTIPAEADLVIGNLQSWIWTIKYAGTLVAAISISNQYPDVNY